MYPTLKSCSNSPATEDETQTTAPTANTIATPEVPETPRKTIKSAAMSNVDKVKPETGLLDEPIKPHMLAETVAKKKPTISITTAAKIAGNLSPEIHIQRKYMSI